MKGYNKPIFFKSNRVRRIYTGGKLFSGFFGDNSADGFFPEEWVCSTTKALNSGSVDEFEGISVTEDNEYFDAIMRSHKKELLGERDELGILVKILDSAIRLPVQAHPDVEFSLKHFNTTHGKTESWIVLATREDACIYFGFKESVSKEDFFKAINGGDDALLPLLNRVPVKVGDVFFIPAKAVHAIGAGCLILEVQEPTDFTIQPEPTCGDYVLNDYEKYLGLSPEDAMECFNMEFFADDAEKCFRKCSNDETQLITKRDTPCFSINRYLVKGQDIQKVFGPAIYVVTDGKGEIYGENYARSLKKGDYFFMPYAASGKFAVKSKDGLQIVECLPPVKK